MKSIVHVFALGLLSIMASLTLSCGKAESEIKVKNPNTPPVVTPDATGTPTAPPAQTPVQPPVTPGTGNTGTVTPASEEMLLNSDVLKTTTPNTPFDINKFEGKNLKAHLRLAKVYTFKPLKKVSLSFKGHHQNIGKSQCELPGFPETTALIKVGSLDISKKWSDLITLEIEANQDVTLKVVIDNSLKCNDLIFEFAVVATDITANPNGPEEEPPVAPTAGLLTVETKEFLSAGTLGACFDLACFTRDLKTSTKKYVNPKNKMEEIVEDHFVMAPSLELVCFNRRNILDNTGITNSICKLNINPAQINNEIKIARGEGKKANVVSVEVTNLDLLKKLCQTWPVVSSDDKVEVFVDDTNKKEIPRLEMTCAGFTESEAAKSATFIGVL